MKKLILFFFIILFVNIYNSFSQIRPNDFVKLTGNFSVSDAGSVQYSIPITLPPGTGGMKPELSLNYNSNGTNGIMGVGWGLSGLSVIARGGKTIAQDGVTEGVKFTRNDVFYLDGERLVLLNNGRDYGDDLAEYGTETNSFIKVISRSSSGNGPGYFEAYTKTGLKMTFGSTDATRIFVPGTKTVLYYLLAKMEENRTDNKGNYMTYEYEKDENNASYRPLRIRYTRNDNASPGTTNLSEVKFNYTERNDVQTAYLNGIKTSITKKLDRIDIIHKTILKETYSFSYFEYGEKKQTLLESVLHCTTNGPCSDPITFSWNTGETELSFNPSNTPIPESSIKGDKKEIYSEDLNNDGLTDIIIANRQSTLQYEIYLNRGDGQFSKIVHNLQSALVTSSLNFIDVNSDGFVDVIITDNNGTNSWYINNKKIGLSGAIFTLAPSQILNSDIQDTLKKVYYFIEYNGDSRLDFFIVDIVTGAHILYENQSDASNLVKFQKKNITTGLSGDDLKNYFLVPVDMDNDGKTDILLHRKTDKTSNGHNKWYRNIYSPNASTIYLLAGENLISPSFFKTDAISSSGNAPQHASNAFCYRNNSTGSCQGSRYPIVGNIGFPNFSDLNADGLIDIIIYQFHSDNMIYQVNSDIEGGLQTQFKKMYYFINRGNFTFESVIDKTSAGQSNITTWKDYDLFNSTSQCFPGVSQRYIENPPGPTDWYGQNTTWLRVRDNQSYFLDINGDGNADMLTKFSYSGAQVTSTKKMENEFYINLKLGLNINLCNNNMKSSITPRNYNLSFGRFNRHGTDIFTYNTKDGKNTLYKNNQDGRPLVITYFGGQLGADNIIVDYTSMNDESVYTKGTSRSYPNIDFSSSGLIVKNYKSYITKQIKGNPEDYFVSSPVADISYKYANGVLNLTGRGFRGFKKVEITDNIQNFRTVKEFEEDSRFIGSNLKSAKTYAPNGVLVSEEIYKNAQIWTRSDGSGGIITTFNIQGVQDSIFTPYPYETTSRTYDLNGTKLVENKSRLLLDGFGNVIYQVFDHGDGCIDSIFHEYDNDYAKWFIGRLIKSTVFKSCPGTSTVIRESAFEYHPTTGLLTKEILEPNQDEKIRTIKTYEHDLFGNITRTTESAWNGTQEVTRAKTAKYSIDGRFQIESTNQLGHKVSVKPDDYRGLPLESTDENGLVTKMEYNDLGILTKTTFPDGNDITASIVQKWPSSFSAFPIGMEAFSSGSNMPLAISEMDILGREIRSKFSTFESENFFSQSQKYFDENNRLETETDPYFESGIAKKITKYEYDIVGRVKKVIQDGNNGTKLNNLYNYTGLTESMTNPLQQTMTTIKDVRQRLFKTIDNASNQLNYKYDTQGQLKQIIVGNNEYIINYEYDLRGRMTAMDDPVLGREEYTYDGFNNLLSKKDGKGNVIKFTYDNLNRVTTISQSEGTVSFTYDQGNKAIGKPSKVAYANYESNLIYDNLGRISQNTISISGKNYVYKYFYNTIGKMDRLEHPSGITLKYHYNSNFYLFKITNNQTNKLLWEQNKADEKNRVTEETFGNGIVTKYTYDIQDNLTSIKSVKGSTIITDLKYEYNAINLKTKKTDAKNNIIETYTYDALNRLINVNATGQINSSLSMTYDKWGNILTKSDLGTYHYNKDVPTLLERIDFINKDCNLPSSKYAYEYTSFNKISKITGDSVRLEITYGADNQRLTQKLFVHNLLRETRTYVASDFEVLVVNNLETKRMSISGTTGTSVIYEITGTQAGKYSYLHRDDQSTVVVITNDLGEIQYTFKYDVWGKRLITQQTENVYGKTYRGYTGHEHIDILELINMNGRIYDPVMARFISPDPYIQDNSNFQNFNRYSYVYNNPVSYIDPSGYFVDKWVKEIWDGATNTISRLTNAVTLIANGNIRDGLKSYGQFLIDVNIKWTGAREIDRQGRQAFGDETWNQIVVASATIVVGIATGGTGAAGTVSLGTAIMSGMAAGAVGGALSAHLAGAGTNDILKAGFKGAVIGGISAGLTHGIGTNVEGFLKGGGNKILGEGLRAIGHGMVQGTMNELQGGKFSQGFFTGMVSSIGSHAGKLYGTNPAGRVFAASIVGGSISSITGGKFATGAVTGAFVEMYNQNAHKETMEKITKWDERDGGMSHMNESDNSWSFREKLDCGVAIAGGFLPPGADSAVAGAYLLGSMVFDASVGNTIYVNDFLQGAIGTIPKVGVVTSGYWCGGKQQLQAQGQLK